MLDRTEREKFLKRLSTREAEGLRWDWGYWARPSQLPPTDPDWLYFMMMAGRGSGKTRAGAEWIRQQKETCPLIALVGNTWDDVRDIMVEGPAGLQAIAPPGDYPKFESGHSRLVWPNGAQAFMYSAQRPDRLRGPQHHVAWCDEMAAWSYPDDTWSNLQFGMRLGRQPRTLITTTPRPIKLVRSILKDPLTRVSRTSTYANRAHVAPAYIQQIIKRYEGTRLGRQEIYAELLEDVPGALWAQEVIEANRLPFGIKLPDFSRIVVAIDPGISAAEDKDETGIIVAAKDRNEHAYVLADHSGHYLPVEWAQIAIDQYRNPERPADRIVAETNNGGEMVENTLRMVDPGVPFKAVTASRGKVVRAEPVSALYEQRRVHHIGMFPVLEDQMCFPAGTLVETDLGEVPIEAVRVGDRVMTRRGYHTVALAAETGCSSEFVVIKTTAGRIIRCTAGHPIFDASQDRFVPARNVYRGMRLVGSPNWASTVSRWHGADIGITAWPTATIDMPRGNSFIARSGRLIAARFQAALRCTIKTAIQATIKSKILNYSRAALTPMSTTIVFGPCGVRLAPVSANWRGRNANGTNFSAGGAANSAALLTKTRHVFAAKLVAAMIELQEAARDFCGHAKSAEPRLSQKTRGAGIAVDAVEIKHTASEKVYNLQVDGPAEYFANGILVHNCSFTQDWDRVKDGSPDRVDALVWAITELLVEDSGPTYLADWGRW